MSTVSDINAAYDEAIRTETPLPMAEGASRLVPSVNWIDELAKPLAEWLKAEGSFKKVHTAGPFGIGARFSVTLMPKEDMEPVSVNPPHDGSMVLTLEPHHDEQGRIRLAAVDYSRPIDNGYPPNSLGALNGLDCKGVVLDETMSAGNVLAMVPTLYHAYTHKRQAPKKTFGDIVSGYMEAYVAQAPIAREDGKPRSDESVNWMDDLIAPFADWLKKEGGYDQAKVMGPFGPMAKISITLTGADKPDAGVTVEPTGMVSTTFLEMVDYSAVPVTYPPNSLGAMTGPQYPTQHIEPALDALGILNMAERLGNKAVQPAAPARKPSRMAP